MTTLRAAVLSAGSWSLASHLPALAADPGVELVAVSSPDPRRREALAGSGAGLVTDRWEQALSTRPDIVVVSSPPVAHEEMVMAALESGANVLVEKPFATDAGVAERMRRAAVDARRALLVGFGWPFSPLFAGVRELIGEGRLGDIEQLTMHLAVNIRGLLSGTGGAGGLESSAIYTDPSIAAGGTVAVSMSHQFGLACWLLGDRIVAVAARTFPAGSRLDLHAGMTVGFAGGGHGTLSSAATHPDRAEPQWHLAVYGSAGQLSLDSTRGELRLVRADGSVDERILESGYDAGAPTRALIAAGRGAPVPDALDADLAVHVCAITDAAYRSAAEGTTLLVSRAGVEAGAVRQQMAD